MSNLPVLLNILSEMDREASSPFYDFGLGIHPQHIGRYHGPRRQRDPYSMLEYALPMSLLNSHQMARRHGERQHGTAGQVSQIGKDGFQVCMDVAQFQPNELNVKVVDNSIVVEGKHEEREDDHGYIKRHFVRRYALPKGYEADKVASTLSSDGVLTISVPKPPALQDKSNERIVQIQQTGPAHLNVKENPQDETKEKQQQNGAGK